MAKEAYEEEQDEGKGTQLATRTTYGPANFDHFMNRNDKIGMFKRKRELEQ